MGDVSGDGAGKVVNSLCRHAMCGWAFKVSPRDSWPVRLRRCEKGQVSVQRCRFLDNMETWSGVEVLGLAADVHVPGCHGANGFRGTATRPLSERLSFHRVRGSVRMLRSYSFS